MTSPSSAPAAAAPGTDSDPAAELAGVWRTYPGPPPVTALAGVTLSIAPAEFVAITGPSGSGKTTLGHILAGLEVPTSGTVRIGGTDVALLNDGQLAGLRATQIGVIFQRFYLDASLTALGNVAMGLLYQGITVHRRRDRARETLQRVGLGHRLGHRPAELSGGEQQRVAIARAIISQPRLLVADEPTGNLDSASGQLITRLLLDLNHDGTAVVLITHDQRLADAAARQIGLRDGRITPGPEAGTP